MPPKNLVVQTQLKPPRLHKRVLSRPRLTQRLLESQDYRLTLVQAGTGYGKSTALAAMTDESDYPVVWYQLGEEVADPALFLLYLLQGFRSVLPGFSDVPAATLEDWKGQGEPPWETFVDLLVNELVIYLDGTLLLILDDAHLLNETPASLRVLDHLITRAPAALSILLSTRYPLKLSTLVKWQVKGEVLEIVSSRGSASTKRGGLLYLQYQSGRVAALVHQGLRPRDIVRQAHRYCTRFIRLDIR